jgi:AbrB family looped-hinge helix DNA binding protein
MNKKTNIVKVVKAYDASGKGGLVVYIPAEIKRQLNLKAGDKFLVLFKDDSIVYKLLKIKEELEINESEGDK